MWNRRGDADGNTLVANNNNNLTDRRAAQRAATESTRKM